MSEHVHGPDCAHGHGAPVRLGAVGGKEPCPCGSGKKYKHCCYRKDLATAGTATQAAPAPAAAEGEGEPAGEPDGEPDAAAPQSRATGRPKAPALARGPVVPPRNPPHGAAKALNRRSGHR